MSDTVARVTNVLGSMLKSSSIDENAQIGITPQWDSLNHIRILIAMEHEFGVRIGAKNAPRLTSVKKIVAFLQEHGEGPSC